MQKILLFTGNGTPAISAANIYFEKFERKYELFIIEETNLTFARVYKTLERRLKKRGVLSCVDLILGRIYAAIFLSPQEVKKMYSPHLVVTDLNSQIVKDLVISSKPDFIITNACSILGRDLISIIECPIINIHNGITPRYRGVGNFWAFNEENLDLTGVTVHQVNEGIDTGERLIVKKIDFLRERIPFKEIDTHAFKEGAGLVVEYVENGRIDIPIPYRRLFSGIYTFPGLTEIISASLKFKKLKSRMINLEDTFLLSFQEQSKSTELTDLQKLHWHDDSTCRERDQFIQALYKKYSRPNWHVLDIGCGDGRYESFLSPSLYTGCDYFVQNEGDSKIIRCSADELPFENQSFDCALGIGLYQHVGSARKVADEMKRVTRKGGVIIINTLRQFTILELIILLIVFFWDSNKINLIWSILKKDYFSGKKINGVLVARRYSKKELKKMFQNKDKPLFLYNGIFKSFLFAREITVVIRI
jgi:ubiquinone/menaquinone biosynthesis C-methylase UbiE